MRRLKGLGKKADSGPWNPWWSDPRPMSSVPMPGCGARDGPSGSPLSRSEWRRPSSQCPSRWGSAPARSSGERSSGWSCRALPFFARRVGRAGLWMGPAGLVVRGPLRTWEVPGNNAVSFSPGVQPSAGNGTPCPILTRSDGSTIGVWALGREGLVFNFDTHLEELRPLCDDSIRCWRSFTPSTRCRGPK